MIPSIETQLSPQYGGAFFRSTSGRKYVILDIGQRVYRKDKPLVWLKGEVKTPPFSAQARLEAGLLLRRLQRRELLSLPQSRPMAIVGGQCHELRINDREHTWRIVYHVAADAVVILCVFSKKTQATPTQVVDVCRRRLASYLIAAAEKE